MARTKPLVSVVIPTYNAAGFLLQAIDSVRAQTFTDYEIIVVNDGSTDDTLDQLRRRGGDVRVITQENRWIGAARNRGIDEAVGKYVAPLDHDDLWMPEKLAAQVEYLESHPQCVAASVPFACSAAPQTPFFRIQEVAAPDGVVARPLKALADGHVFITSSALMFDRQRAAGVRYATRRGAVEDVPFHINLFSRGAIGVAGQSILAIWRWHDQNSGKQSSYVYDGQKELRAMDARGEFQFRDAEDRADLSAYLAHLGRVAAVTQLAASQRRRALELYLEEFGHQLRLHKLKFLTAFPALLCAPRALLLRFLKSNAGRDKSSDGQ